VVIPVRRSAYYLLENPEREFVARAFLRLEDLPRQSISDAPPK
jgi:hypothetical protein